jgi:hypothetical protein
MRAPHYERQSLLAEALDQATDTLMEPVDSIVVKGDQIEVIAGSLRLAGPYGYAGGVGPGSGYWWVEFGEPETVAA